MNDLLQDVRDALSHLPKGLVLTLAAAISLSVAMAVCVVDAMVIVPVPYESQHNLVLAVLVSRADDDATRPQVHHLKMQAKLRSLDEPAEFSMMGELSLAGPNGLVSFAGILPGRDPEMWTEPESAA